MSFVVLFPPDGGGGAGGRYGHTHNQQCDGTDSHGQCNEVLTGGGGGCCAPEVNLAGFTAVHLTEDGGYTLDVESEAVRMHGGQCKF